MDMWKKFAVLAMMTSLAACSGDTAGGGGGSGGGNAGETLTKEIGGNVRGATYNSSDETLVMNIAFLDASPVNAIFRRDPGSDVPGYKAFSYQEASTQRNFTALFAAREGVVAGIAGDGGQFAQVVSGAALGRTGDYSQPTSGLATYEGRYAGILNAGTGGGGLNPGKALTTRGTVRINADFTNGSINGGVTNRSITQNGQGLDDFFLKISPIGNNGKFKGEVMNADLSTIGTYQGLFGGAGAKNVGVVTKFTPGFEGEQIPDAFERGVIVIGCTKANNSKGVKCK
jgi:hypothetical protein